MLVEEDGTPKSDSNEQEGGWSTDDILALSNSKKAQDLLDSLTDEEKEVYRCKYCEEKYTNPNRRKIKFG